MNLVNPRLHAGASLAAITLLLTSCAAHSATHAATGPTASSTPAGAHASLRAGMVMADGSTMGAHAARPRSGRTAVTSSTAGRPSAAERMICGSETRTAITQVLGLTSPPNSAATWRNHTFTCRYRLPMGNFVISVTQSTDSAAAKQYFSSLRTTLGATTTLAGLGQGAYGTTAGKVVLIKDHDTLTVDASTLPPILGKQQSKRADFAYEIASTILGCWTDG